METAAANLHEQCHSYVPCFLSYLVGIFFFSVVEAKVKNGRSAEVTPS